MNKIERAELAASIARLAEPSSSRRCKRHPEAFHNEGVCSECYQDAIDRERRSVYLGDFS